MLTVAEIKIDKILNTDSYLLPEFVTVWCFQDGSISDRLAWEKSKWFSIDLTGFEVEPLLHVEWSKLRWPRHLFWMPPRRFTGEVFWSYPKGRKPRTRWRDYVSWLAWENLGVTPNELNEVTGVREVRIALLLTLQTEPGMNQ